jgi:hypothetical protein
LASVDSAPLLPPDIVRLRSGEAVRGSIREAVPDESVTIATPSGEILRFAWNDVAYAGLAKEQAPIAASSPKVEALPSVSNAPATFDAGARAVDEARQALQAKVHFSSDGGSPLTIYVETAALQTSAIAAQPSSKSSATEGYHELCKTPCDVAMPLGSYRFGLGRPGKRMRVADPVVLTRGDHSLATEFESRARLRTLGWLTFIVTATVGVTLMRVAKTEHCGYVLSGEGGGACVQEREPYGWYTGLTLLTMAPGGIVLGFVPDRVEVHEANATSAVGKTSFIPRIAPLMTRMDGVAKPSGLHFDWQF